MANRGQEFVRHLARSFQIGNIHLGDDNVTIGCSPFPHHHPGVGQLLDRWYPFGKMVPLEARGYLLVVRARRWGAAPLEAGLQKLCEFSSWYNQVSCEGVDLAVSTVTGEQSTVGIIHSKAVCHILDSIENPVSLTSIVAQILCLIARFLVNLSGQSLA